MISYKGLLQTLRDEKAIHLSGGLYHELQVRMTYYSNHIEGNRLSEEQIRYIFETRTLAVEGSVSVDDIIETVNHFRAIDFVIELAEEPLTEEGIKELHRLLKQNTGDASLSWFAVGEYKERPNVVGGRETTPPNEVAHQMSLLLEEYASRKEITFEDIVEFHARFERIHPFQDGNGRVGRLIALKECLRYEMIPFLIEDTKKMFYYRGLAEWEKDKRYLLDTCLDGQDVFKALMAMFQS